MRLYLKERIYNLFGQCACCGQKLANDEDHPVYIVDEDGKEIFIVKCCEGCAENCDMADGDLE